MHDQSRRKSHAPLWLRSMILRNLIIALAYVATGWFGLTFFSAPPGYATTIFLPAGIAVGAVLFFWFPALPGIFFGSYLLNVLIGYAIFEQQITAQAIANAVLIATVSTLQAAVGGWLFRFKLSFRSVTLISRHNLLLLSAWAPLICLTSATLSVTGLWLLNTVSTAAFLTNWLHWWIGDTFGVLVLLPWMLFFLPADVQIKKWTEQMLHNNARLH